MSYQLPSQFAVLITLYRGMGTQKHPNYLQSQKYINFNERIQCSLQFRIQFEQ